MGLNFPSQMLYIRLLLQGNFNPFSFCSFSSCSSCSFSSSSPPLPRRSPNSRTTRTRWRTRMSCSRMTTRPNRTSSRPPSSPSSCWNNKKRLQRSSDRYQLLGSNTQACMPSPLKIWASEHLMFISRHEMAPHQSPFTNNVTQPNHVRRGKEREKHRIVIGSRAEENLILLMDGHYWEERRMLSNTHRSHNLLSLMYYLKNVGGKIG